MTATPRAIPVAWRSVALPIEHGAWGFLLEPLLLGLLVAFSGAGVAVAWVALLTLLLQTPVSLIAADARRGRVYRRTRLARWVAAGYASAWLAGVAVVAVAVGAAPFLPALVAVPLAAVQLWYDARNRAREAIPEVAGALAMGAAAACIAVAGGWTLPAALGLWGLLALRTVPAIVYVRARLRLERGVPVAVAPTWAWHLAAVAVAAAAWGAGTLGWPALAATCLLWARAAWGVSPWRRPVAAKVVGVSELAFGAATAVLFAWAVAGAAPIP